MQLILFLSAFISLTDGLSGLGIDVVPNLSPSSGLSIGDENNDRMLNESAMPDFVDIMRMSDGQTYLEEVTTEDLQLPLGVKVMQNNVSDDLCLTSEDNGEYGDFQYDNNILDDIAMSILDPDSNIMSIFGETMENPDQPSAEMEGKWEIIYYAPFIIRSPHLI